MALAFCLSHFLSENGAARAVASTLSGSALAMLLLSLGPKVLIGLLHYGYGEREGPDLCWLLYGPEWSEDESDSSTKTTK